MVDHSREEGLDGVTLPTDHLVQKTRVTHDEGGYLSLRGILNRNIPALGLEPAGQEDIVASVHELAVPSIIGDGLHESRVLGNVGTNHHGATNHAPATAIGSETNGLNIVLVIERAEGGNLPGSDDGRVAAVRVDESAVKVRILLHGERTSKKERTKEKRKTLHIPLLASDAADLGVLKTSQEVGQSLQSTPEGIVIDQSKNLTLGLLNADSHLVALAGVLGSHDADAVIALDDNGLDQVVDTLKVTVNGDNDDLLGFVGKPETKAVGEGIGGIDGSDNDADISALEAGLLRKGNGLGLLHEPLGQNLIVGIPGPVKK